MALKEMGLMPVEAQGPACKALSSEGQPGAGQGGPQRGHVLALCGPKGLLGTRPGRAFPGEDPGICVPWRVNARNKE